VGEEIITRALRSPGSDFRLIQVDEFSPFTQRDSRRRSKSSTKLDKKAMKPTTEACSAHRLGFSGPKLASRSAHANPPVCQFPPA
jgi:hypothetical protein